MSGLDFTLNPRWQTEISDYVNGLAWSPDGSLVVAAAVSGAITIFEAASGEIVQLLPGHGFGTTAVVWHPNGQSLASAGQDGKIRLWDAKDGQEIANMNGGAEWVEHLAWCPDGELLASAAGRKLRLWNAKGHLIRAYPEQSNTINSLQWNVMAQPRLASGGYGGVTLWSPDSSEPVQRFDWKGAILAIAWSPDERLLATGDQDCTAHLWYVENGQDVQLWGFQTKVRELAWDSTSRYLATGGGMLAAVWDCSGAGPTSHKPLVLEAHEGYINQLHFQHAAPLLASGGQDGRVILWQPTATKKPLAQVQQAAAISQLAWSPADTCLAIGTHSGTVGVYQI